MKRLFFIFSIFAMLLTSCETIGENQKQQAIKLTSKDIINVGAGSSMGIITYELVTPVEGETITAEADVDWIGDFDHKQQGKIQFTVAKNPTDSEREGVITVNYAESSFAVIVKQAANPKPTSKTINMPTLMGSYYGVQAGMYNYYLVFTDIATDNNYYCPDATYYIVDLYMLETPEDMDNITAPLGEYSYDITNSGIPGTFTETYSWYQHNDAEGYDEFQIAYDKGSLKIEEGKITLDITLTIDGVQENHIVIYEGGYTLRNEA